MGEVGGLHAKPEREACAVGDALNYLVNPYVPSQVVPLHDSVEVGKVNMDGVSVVSQLRTDERHEKGPDNHARDEVIDEGAADVEAMGETLRTRLGANSASLLLKP